MKRLALIAAIVVAAVSASLVWGPSPTAKSATVCNVLCQHNRARAARGIPRLRGVREPTTIAKARAIVACQQFRHDPCGDYLFGPWRAENIAMGQRTALEVHRDWMSSPGHRAAILDRRYTRLTVAHVGPVWVAHFQ